MAANKKIIIAVNSTFNLVNYRAGLINGLIDGGYEVIAVSPTDEFALRLKELGCQHVPLEMERKGTNIGRDLMLFWRLRLLLKKHMPDIYLGFTIKPNIYGSLAAQSLGIPVINNISGLGNVFGAMKKKYSRYLPTPSIKGQLLSNLVRIMYWFALSRSKIIFFQNKDDRKEFIEQGVVKRHLTGLLPGSGVNLEHFAYVPKISKDFSLENCNEEKQTRFLLIARLLWDKGVGEYVEAARILSARYPHAEFCLLGFLDFQNPEAISEAQINEWIEEGIVKHLGVRDDVRSEIEKADCVVLPTLYREGVPRSLLESAAIGRPIITTNSVGSRDTVDDGVNGYLCIPGDSIDLSEKMERMLLLDEKQRREMGKYGRKKMELQFDEHIVIQKYLETIKEILN